VPSCPLEELKGLRVGNLGKRLYDEHLQEGVDPRGRPYYWIGGGGDVFADLEGSDCTLVNDGYASVSVLSPSLLNTNANQDLKHRLEGPNK
jgi:5'-nucleotidase